MPIFFEYLQIFYFIFKYFKYIFHIYCFSRQMFDSCGRNALVWLKHQSKVSSQPAKARKKLTALASAEPDPFYLTFILDLLLISSLLSFLFYKFVFPFVTLSKLFSLNYKVRRSHSWTWRVKSMAPRLLKAMADRQRYGSPTDTQVTITRSSGCSCQELITKKYNLHGSLFSNKTQTSSVLTALSWVVVASR